MLIFLFILLAIGGVAEWWTLKHGLDEVTYSLTPDKGVVDPDEVFSITTTIKNRKRMPISFLRVKELMPPSLEFVREDELNITRDLEHTMLTSSLYLGSRKASSRSLEVSLKDRGTYYFTGCTFYGGDFLGVSQDVRYLSQNAEVVVCPRPSESLELQEVLGSFLGDISVRRFILEDPVLTVGFREYTGREPFRAISWTQSARGRGIMVKQYDYTAEPSVTVMLNVEYRGDLTREMAARIEECYSVARTVCETLEQKGVRFDFITNATTAGAAGRWTYVEEGMGSRHLNTIIEGLGRAGYGRIMTFDRLVARAMRRSDSGRGRILITPALLDGYQKSIDRLSARCGGSIRIITPDELTHAEEAAQ